MIIAGLDEAGRGPLIGPMVIAGISIDSEKIYKLKEIGVKDSKLLTPYKREKIMENIIQIAYKVRYIYISAKEIDDAVFSSLKITGLEAKYMSNIINELNPDIVYIDSPINNTSKFKNLLKEYLSKNIEIICENKADKKYLVVAAASIIAKVLRDREISELHKKYGNFGSGYTSDVRTIEFLKRKIQEGNIPEEVRKSWITYKKLLHIKGMN